jgi:hypothetical protein
VLDKTADAGYNTYIGYSEVNYIHTTKLRNMSNNTMIDLMSLSKSLDKLTDKYNTRPVIAGGAVRDLLMGYCPKDFDVFVDISAVEDEDEQQDFIDSFLYDFCVDMSGNYFYNLNNIGWPYSILPTDTSKTPLEYINMENTFQVYEWGMYQFIFMKDPMIQENPGQWILDRFDYSLVKCFIDPSTHKVYASDEFMRDREAKHIEVKDMTTYARVMKWTKRNGIDITPNLLYVEKDKNESYEAKPSAMP